MECSRSNHTAIFQADKKEKDIDTASKRACPKLQDSKTTKANNSNGVQGPFAKSSKQLKN